METMTEFFKSLSDQTRLRILNLLNSHGELCVCDLMGVLSLPQSTASRHLSILKSSGILTARKAGLWHYYKINEDFSLGKEIVGILQRELAHDPEGMADIEKLNEKCCEPMCSSGAGK